MDRWKNEEAENSYIKCKFLTARYLREKKENSRLNCFVRPIHLNRKMILFFLLPFVSMVGPFTSASSKSNSNANTYFDGIANYSDCLFSSESARCNGRL